MKAAQLFRQWFARNAVTPASMSTPGTLSWQCNICGVANCTEANAMARESGECLACNAPLRFRSLIAVLTERLFGKVQVLASMAASPQITGLGMSDDDRYAGLLAEKFSYSNTYYHCEPWLDITKPAAKWLGCNDFVLSADVFEHVPPPVQPAFDQLFSLLKPGGVVVFSVPFSLDAETCEHYPSLHDYQVRQQKNGEWVLENVTREGVKETFRDLVFHGGPGSTLEMRLFSLAALQRHFAAAGFVDFRVHNESHFESGIFWCLPWSLMISANRPL
jgi:SAM-dependent methyltransferase